MLKHSQENISVVATKELEALQTTTTTTTAATTRQANEQKLALIEKQKINSLLEELKQLEEKITLCKEQEKQTRLNEQKHELRRMSIDANYSNNTYSLRYLPYQRNNYAVSVGKSKTLTLGTLGGQLIGS